MFKAKQNREGAELARRIKKVADTITVSYQRVADLLPFEWGRPGAGRSELLIEDLFQIAKELDPNLERDGERARQIYEAISKHSPKELDEFYNVLTGMKYDAFRVGYFAGVLMGAHLSGDSDENMRRLTARLYKLILAEGFELAPTSKPALKAA